MPMTLQRRVFEALDVRPDDRGVEKGVNRFLLVLIVANVVAVVSETVDGIGSPFAAAFRSFEAFSVAVFTIEYALRVWSCTEDPRYEHPLSGRLRFALSFPALVDLVSILPSLLPGGAWDLRFVRLLRLARLARTLKIVRHSSSLRRVGRVLRAKRDDLAVTGVAGAVLLVGASSLMYYVEHEAQPRLFSSIPASMWWAAETLTTLGYGDMYPVTPLGKVLGGLVAIAGVGFFAMPAGILASGFSEEIRRKHPKACPHCGRAID